MIFKNGNMFGDAFWVLCPPSLTLSPSPSLSNTFFQSHLGDTANIVRVMPNTPAAVGQGMSVLCANSNVSNVQKQLCEALLEAVGQSAWLDDEALMDAVTAVSGSGPASS